MKNRYDRPAYTAILEKYRNGEHIKVLKGVRRCGKSTLLDLLIERLRAEGVPEQNLIRRRFDEFGMALDQTAETLQADLSDAFSSAHSGTVYVFLDEIQMVEGWEKVVRGLHTRADTDVYITGSNAYLLSSDLATYLAGRYAEIDVFPLSFKEYLDFSERTGLSLGSSEKAFARYLRYGGMPSLFALRDADEQDYARELSAIYDSVILSDVAQHLAIRDYALLSKLVAYVFSTSGNLFSVASITNYLRSAGIKTSVQTIDSYLYGLEEALIMYGAKQVGLQGRQLLRPLRKFYPVDTGLRNLSIGFALKDIGFQLENAVFMELMRRGYDVSIGAMGKAEVDFVAQRNDERLYIQVCDRLGDDAVMERELAPLQKIGDSFAKMVLTTDTLHAGTTPDGIRVMSLIDWLLDS